MCLRYQSRSVTESRTRYWPPKPGALASPGSCQHFPLDLPLTRTKQLTKQIFQLGREIPLTSKHVIMTTPPSKNFMIIIIIY